MQVKSVRIIKQSFGFVEFADRPTAEAAMKASQGRRLDCNLLFIVWQGLHPPALFPQPLFELLIHRIV